MGEGVSPVSPRHLPVDKSVKNVTNLETRDGGGGGGDGHNVTFQSQSRGTISMGTTWDNSAGSRATEII